MGIKYSSCLHSLILSALGLLFLCSCSNDDVIIDGEVVAGLYGIDQSELGEWEDGIILTDGEISDKSIYLLSKQLNTERVLYLNSLSNKLEEGVTIFLKGNNSIGEIIYDDIVYSGEYTENRLILHPHNENESEISLPLTNTNKSMILSRAGSSWWSGGELITTLIDLFQNGGKFINGDYANLFVALSTDQLISMLKLGAKGNVLTWIGIELANRAAFAAIKNALYHGSIPILNEKRDGNKLYVSVAPNNIDDSSGPMYLGISIIENPARINGVIKIPTYTNYTKRSAFIQINSQKDKYEFVYNFSDIGNYDIVPFMISHSVIQDYETEFVREWFVQYGEIQYYSFPTICIKSIEKKLCGNISDDIVAFRLIATLVAEDYNVLSSIGLSVVNQEDEVSNSSKSISGNSDDVNLIIEGKIPSENFDENGKTLLRLAPYGQKGEKKVFGEIFEYYLSMPSICPNENHPHLIDLGLPSGKLWSCCNVGCNSPEKHGGYFAFGETCEKNSYTWESYFDPNFTIQNSISGNPKYDAATNIMGSGYRTPTMVEAQELISNCSWEVYEIDGINGVLGTGKSGNKIFMPSCGSKIDFKTEGYNEWGEYWLADGLTSIISHPFYMYFDAEYITAESLNGYGRRSGKSVRAIHD